MSVELSNQAASLPVARASSHERIDESELQNQTVMLLRQLLADVQDLRQRIDGKQKDFLTISEVANLLGRAEYTVRSWIKAKRLNAIRVTGTGPRGRLLVPRDELLRLVCQGKGEKMPDVV